MPFRNDPRFRQSGFFTSTGKALLLDDPRPEHIDIRDIAMSLARQCRFGSNLRGRFMMYSVAQHSVLVSRESGIKAKEGLLHDGDEFSLGDVIRPVARVAPNMARHELRIKWWAAIGDRFDIEIVDNKGLLPPEVHEADNRVLATEIRDLYWNIGHEVESYEPYYWSIYPWDVELAYNNFLQAASVLGLYDGLLGWPRV